MSNNETYTTYTALSFEGSTWRDVVWNFLGTLMLHPYTLYAAYKWYRIRKRQAEQFDEVYYMRFKRNQLH